VPARVLEYAYVNKSVGRGSCVLHASDFEEGRVLIGGVTSCAHQLWGGEGVVSGYILRAIDDKAHCFLGGCHWGGGTSCVH